MLDSFGENLIISFEENKTNNFFFKKIILDIFDRKLNHNYAFQASVSLITQRRSYLMKFPFLISICVSIRYGTMKAVIFNIYSKKSKRKQHPFSTVRM